MHSQNAAQEPQLVFILPNRRDTSSTTSCFPMCYGPKRTDPGQCPALDAWTPMDDVIVISSDDDHDHSEEDILLCLGQVDTRRDRRPDAQVRTAVNLTAPPTVESATVSSECRGSD